MTRRFLAIALVAALPAVADPVTPATLVLTNFTDVGAVTTPTQTEFFQGDTLSLSNCVMFTGATTNSARQNLAGCAITVRAGSAANTALVTSVTGYSISTNLGTWGASFVVPAVDPCVIEVTVSNVASRTYEHYQVNTRKHLGQ